MLDNKTIYKKTIGFSLRRLFWDFLALILVLGVATLGFMVAEKQWDQGLVGLIIGAIVGIIVIAIALHFISYTLKAGQIAMMTKGIVEGELPDNVIAEGKKIVKQRFKTVAAYFAITGVIKGIFDQIGKGITKVGEGIGGEAGGTIGSTISSILQTIVSYLCDCCLGWVFFRANVSAAKATCEGAVLFFKHGKTFGKNMGRIFGIGILSFVIVVGVVGGIAYLILSTQSGALNGVYNEIAQVFAGSDSSIARWFQDPATIPFLFSLLGGIIVWSFVHATFIRPFVLVGVLRNYIESGKDDIPSEDSFAALDKASPKFRKLHGEI